MAVLMEHPLEQRKAVPLDLRTDMHLAESMEHWMAVKMGSQKVAYWVD